MNFIQFVLWSLSHNLQFSPPFPILGRILILTTMDVMKILEKRKENSGWRCQKIGAKWSFTIHESEAAQTTMYRHEVCQTNFSGEVTRPS